MRRCQSCNAELPELARFCSNCGYVLSPTIDVQSDDAPTAISNASLPTVISEMPKPDDAPTVMSNPSLRAVPETPNPDDSTLWGWSYDQDVQNSQLPGGRQTEESQSLPLDPFFPGAPSTLSSPSAGQMPMVQGTPQVGGVPSVQGTPSMLSSSPPAANVPPPVHGLGHEAAASAPSPSMPPSASPPPKPLWRVQTPQTHDVVHTPSAPTAPYRHKATPPKVRSKTRQLKFDEAVKMIVSLKNARALLLFGLILLVLGGSAGVLVLDEKLERGDSVGFLRFEEGIERLLVEDITHNRTHAIATAYTIAATGTAAALQHPFPQNGTLVLNDPLTSNSKLSNWTSGYYSNTGTACTFANGAYHVVESNLNHFYYCIASNTNFSNFIFQVQMTILRGNAGGIIFRDIGPANNYFRLYYFSIGRNGTYNLQRFVHDSAHSSNQLVNGQSTFIKTGLGQSNLITAVARGNNIDLYVNQRYLTSVTDSTYSQGEIGLAAQDQGDPTEVAFSNAQVYTLP
jgi:hypothetical protein